MNIKLMNLIENTKSTLSKVRINEKESTWLQITNEQFSVLSAT